MSLPGVNYVGGRAYLIVAEQAACCCAVGAIDGDPENHEERSIAVPQLQRSARMTPR